MIIAHNIDRRIGICDIETVKELFDVGIYDIDNHKWIEFEVSAYKNELLDFVTWYTLEPLHYLVTFNGIGFDQQVLQYVVDNYSNWMDLDGKEIANKIYLYAQKVIEDSKYGIPHKYKESDFSIPSIDLFKIHHFDNEAKMTSLKWCSFMMNMDVEEIPIPHDRQNLTREEIEEIKSYRRNDVKVTQALLHLTIGEVDKIKEINGGNDIEELSIYRGKNKIQERFDVEKETGIKCLNFSDVKIGEEWNMRDYMKAKGIKDRSALFSKKIKYPFGKKFKDFFPPTVSFQTEQLKRFVRNLGEEYVKNEKQEFYITINETKYTIAKGGLHSKEKNRKINTNKNLRYIQIDVGGQYPNSIVKLGIVPPHLDKIILSQYNEKIDRRTTYKKIAHDLKIQKRIEEAAQYSSIQEMLKLCNNGGYYGKLGQKGSFLEYPEGLLKCCISNELEILMLIEELELKGFKVVSANTDGCDVLFAPEKHNELLEICKWWEEKVGNIKLGKLEHTEFTDIWQDSVNSYIARKVDNLGKVSSKKKGGFTTEFEMYRNKSKRIIPLALEAYFIEGKDPVEFIRNHKNIFDFCIAKKATGKLYYEEQWEEKGKILTKRHKKLVRYFISKEGTVLFKRGINNEGNPMNNHCEAPIEIGQPKITYFNKFFSSNNYNINYDYYILEVLERIDNITKSKMKKSYIEKINSTKQTSLF